MPLRAIASHVVRTISSERSVPVRDQWRRHASSTIDGGNLGLPA